MFQVTARIINPTGLHARPAADFVAKAKEYHARVTVGRAGEETAVNAKSIIMLMSGAFVQGDEMVITAEGKDEQQAAEALAMLVASGFGELN